MVHYAGVLLSLPALFQEQNAVRCASRLRLNPSSTRA